MKKPSRLRSRLRGGLLNKARRGELRCRLLIGFVYAAAGLVVLDPDSQVQETVRLLFSTFARTGGVSATVKHFRQPHLQERLISELHLDCPERLPGDVFVQYLKR